MVYDFHRYSNPASNTGLDSRSSASGNDSKWSVGVDWLDFTFRAVEGVGEAYELLDQVEIVIDEQFEFSPSAAVHNGRQWEGSGHGSKGSMCWYKAPYEDEFGGPHPAQLKIAMSGSTLAKIKLMELAEWLRVAGENRELDCTRIDLALDDHNKIIKMGKIADAREKGNFFNCSYSERVTSCRRGEIEGVTIYFGSRASDKRLRIYDKTIESKGATLGNRWEAQFRRGAAYEVFSVWLKACEMGERTTARVLQNIVLGLIDFRSRDNDDPNRSRCPRLAWFEAMLSILSSEPARISVTKVEQSLQKSIDWIKRSVGSTLASLRAVLGTEYASFIDRAATEGGERLSITRRLMMERADKRELLY